MIERIRKQADYALHNETFPVIQTVTYDPADAGLPEPVRIAKQLKEFLLNQPIIIGTNELLACRMRFDDSVTGDVYTTAGHMNYRGFFKTHSDSNPTPLCFLDWNHFCTDYAFVLENGIIGYISKIKKIKPRYIMDKEKSDLLTGMEMTCDAIISWADHCSAQYRESAQLQTDRVRKEELIRMSEICKNVPMNAASDFYEAVQSIWFMFLLMPDSLGRLDQYLYKFYKQDLSANKITKENACALIEELLIKVFEYKGYREHRSGDNALVVGGYLANGEDGFNELSELILEAISELPTWRPQASFRWTAKTPFSTLKLIVEFNKKCKNIVFTNDETRLKGFQKLGVSYEDAVNYTMIGCNEWAITGKSNTGADGYFNPLKSLEDILNNHSSDLGSFELFEDFYAYYEKRLEKDISIMMDLADAFFDVRAKDASVLSSIFIEGCIEKAIYITNGGAKYNASCWSVAGLINLVDSLSVIKQFVFCEKSFTFGELSDMCRCNWKGYEDIRLRILKRGIFFGNDQDFVDEIAVKIIDTLYSFTNRRFPKKGGKFIFGSMVAYNSAHITMGARTGATPDGRHSGDAFVVGIGAAPAKAQLGVTALMKSVTKIDYSNLSGPVVVNLTLEKSMVDSDEKLERIAHLFETYFKLGGVQLQPDYLSIWDLIKAQKDPDEYKNLRVRVTGYSGFFTSFDKNLQDEIISRMVHEND